MFFIGLKMTVYGRNMLPWCDLSVYIISLHSYILLCVCVCVYVCIDGIINYKCYHTTGWSLSNSFTPMFSALHGSEGSGHKLHDYDTVHSSIRGQNFEGVYLYDKVRRNIIIPSSTLNMWHCVRSVHRCPSTRIYCALNRSPLHWVLLCVKWVFARRQLIFRHDRRTAHNFVEF